MKEKKSCQAWAISDEFWGAIKGELPKMEYAESLSDLLQMGISALLLDHTVFSNWHRIYQDEMGLSSYQIRNVRLENDICRNTILAEKSLSTGPKRRSSRYLIR